MTEEFNPTPEENVSKHEIPEDNISETDNTKVITEDDLSSEDSTLEVNLTSKQKILFVSIGAAVLVSLLGLILDCSCFPEEAARMTASCKMSLPQV